MLCGICLSSESVNIEIVRSLAQRPERKRKTHEQTTGSRTPRFHRITSNRDRSEWAELFGEPLLASAALDRLTHDAHFVEITGHSFRAEHTKKQLTARRTRGGN
jgi:DNA replication protein DnaC